MQAPRLTNRNPVATYFQSHIILTGVPVLTGQLSSMDAVSEYLANYQLIGEAPPGFSLATNGHWTFDPQLLNLSR